MNPGLAGGYAATATLYAGSADHPARRERAEPSPHAGRAPAGGRGPRGVHDRGRGEVRDGAGRSHHHAADALARSRPRGDGAGGLARRPRHPARAELRRKLGFAHAASGAAHDEHGLVRGRADGGGARAAPLALRGHRLSPGALAVADHSQGAREGWPRRRCGDARGPAARQPAHGRLAAPDHGVPGRVAQAGGADAGASGGRAAASFTWSRAAARASSAKRSSHGEEGDCFVAPPWHWIEHRNHSGAAPACLFHLTDEPALTALGLWREELAPAPRLTGSRAAGGPRLGARRGNPARTMRRVELRGGARRLPPRRTFCTLSVAAAGANEADGPLSVARGRRRSRAEGRPGSDSAVVTARTMARETTRAATAPRAARSARASPIERANSASPSVGR